MTMESKEERKKSGMIMRKMTEVGRGGGQARRGALSPPAMQGHTSRYICISICHNMDKYIFKC